jgi:hypothetical protein
LSDTRWLKRLRRELAGSGRRSQLALLLAGRDAGERENWSRRLHAILLGEETPDPELILRIESLLARPRAAVPAQGQGQGCFAF